MARIDASNDVMTLINVFKVPAEKQNELVTLLIDATDETMKHLPGFISAN